jgi:vacuolar-type H+-ATPase catalytic subunit A/Vma1
MNKQAFLAGYMSKEAYGYGDEYSSVGNNYSLPEEFYTVDDGLVAQTDMSKKMKMLKTLQDTVAYNKERGAQTKFSNERYGEHMDVETIKKLLQESGEEPVMPFFSEEVSGGKNILGLRKKLPEAMR